MGLRGDLGEAGGAQAPGGPTGFGRQQRCRAVHAGLVGCAGQRGPLALGQRPWAGGECGDDGTQVGGQRVPPCLADVAAGSVAVPGARDTGGQQGQPRIGVGACGRRLGAPGCEAIPVGPACLVQVQQCRAGSRCGQGGRDVVVLAARCLHQQPGPGQRQKRDEQVMGDRPRCLGPVQVGDGDHQRLRRLCQFGRQCCRCPGGVHQQAAEAPGGASQAQAGRVQHRVHLTGGCRGGARSGCGQPGQEVAPAAARGPGHQAEPRCPLVVQPPQQGPGRWVAAGSDRWQGSPVQPHSAESPAEPATSASGMVTLTRAPGLSRTLAVGRASASWRPVSCRKPGQLVGSRSGVSAANRSPKPAPVTCSP